MPKYLVKTGLNYGKDDRRADPGDVIDDISAEQAKRAVRDGTLEEIKGRTPHGAKAEAKAEAKEALEENKAEAKQRQEPAATSKKKGAK